MQKKRNKNTFAISLVNFVNVSSVHHCFLFVQRTTSQWRVFGRRTWWTRNWSRSFGKSSAWPTMTSTWFSRTLTWESRLAPFLWHLQIEFSKRFERLSKVSPRKCRQRSVIIMIRIIINDIINAKYGEKNTKNLICFGVKKSQLTASLSLN